jgi:hypothetical protein
MKSKKTRRSNPVKKLSLQCTLVSSAKKKRTRKKIVKEPPPPLLIETPPPPPLLIETPVIKDEYDPIKLTSDEVANDPVSNYNEESGFVSDEDERSIVYNKQRGGYEEEEEEGEDVGDNLSTDSEDETIGGSFRTIVNDYSDLFNYHE